MKRFFFLFFSLFSIGGCREKSPDGTPLPVEIETGEMMLVNNEGNFQWGNATAGLVNLHHNQIWEDAFKSQNNRPLGDIFQSATRIGNEWWLVVNNSGKIETLSATDFKSTGTISGLTSPRYALQISTNQVLVSDLYANGASVIDIPTKTKTGFIPLSGWTEGMVLAESDVWVVNKHRPRIYVLNINSLTVVDSISLPGKGSSIKQGPPNKIWVGFAGDSLHKGGIQLLDIPSKTIVNSWLTPENGQTPDRFEISETGDSLFFLNLGAYLLSATKNGFAPKELISKADGNWYGLGYDSKRQTLYLSDAKDYLQKSTIRVLDLKTGQRKPGLKVGVTSGHFYFF